MELQMRLRGHHYRIRSEGFYTNGAPILRVRRLDDSLYCELSVDMPAITMFALRKGDLFIAVDLEDEMVAVMLDSGIFMQHGLHIECGGRRATIWTVANGYELDYTECQSNISQEPRRALKYRDTQYGWWRERERKIPGSEILSDGVWDI